MVRVQPDLEPIDVAIGARLSGRPVTMREVVVEARCRSLGLADDGGRDRSDDEDQRRQEAQVHDRDRDAARQPHPLERADDRVEEKRDEPGDHEEEHDVTRRRRDEPRQHEQQRQPDKLDPARDLDPRRAPGDGHVADATATIRPLRPPAWDWTFDTDGALALDGALWDDRGVWDEPSGRRSLRLVHGSPLNDPGESATVPPMSPQPARRRGPASRRRHLERERRLRRLAVLVTVAVVAVVVVLLSAFGGAAAPAPQIAAASASRLAPGRPADAAGRREGRDSSISSCRSASRA